MGSPKQTFKRTAVQKLALDCQKHRFGQLTYRFASALRIALPTPLLSALLCQPFVMLFAHPERYHWGQNGPQQFPLITY